MIENHVGTAGVRCYVAEPDRRRCAIGDEGVSIGTMINGVSRDRDD